VIRSLIGNIALIFMFHCMNLGDCISWIWVLVPFLVMCGFIFPVRTKFPSLHTSI